MPHAAIPLIESLMNFQSQRQNVLCFTWSPTQSRPLTDQSISDLSQRLLRLHINLRHFMKINLSDLVNLVVMHQLRSLLATNAE